MKEKNNENVFNIEYGRLNKSQKMAVDMVEGPVMVIAGPGTGKTTILTLRIANILRKTDTPAHGILAITYTNAGVKAIREKLERIVGSRAHDVCIHTFHSFASSIIAEHPEHFTEISDMKTLDDVGKESIIRKILENKEFSILRPFGKPDAYMSAIVSTIIDAKKNNMDYRMVASYNRDEIERIKNDEESISTRGATKGKLKAEALSRIEKCEKTIVFSEVFKLYEEEKNKAKKLDFDDLIIELLKKLREDELLLRLVQEQFLYIHIDEHQDTNDLQNSIISIIAEFFDTPNIFIVGDEKQAIYRFQGASVENFMLLKNKWPAMKMISLDMNYRSHQNILDASFSMIENNYHLDEYSDLRIRLKGEKAKDKIKIVTGENTRATEYYLIEELKNIRKNEPQSTIAIITRKNRELDRIIEVLESENISVSSERSIDIFHNPIGILFFDLIEYIVNPNKIDLLSKTIISGLWNIGFEDGMNIIKLLRSGKDIKIEEKIPELLEIRKSLINENIIASLISIAKNSGFIKIISKDPSYIYVWQGIISLAESLAHDDTVFTPIELINSMLLYRLSAENKVVKIPVGAPDIPIKAMTAHGSKGLEFDYVFMPYLNDENWIGKNRGYSFVLPRKQAGQNDIEDIRRLFYVSITRAKKNVTLLPSLEESNAKVLTPLRFINEIDKKYTEEITLSRKDANISIKDLKSDIISSKIINLAKDTVLENGLSVTALNHFMECPNKFIYQSILKLPQAGTISSEKGKAMHSAISRVWRNENRNKENIESDLSQGILDYINESLLSINEKETLKKELLESIPDLLKALYNHWSTDKVTIYTEHWIRSLYKSKYQDKVIEIPIHGQLDAIIDNGHEVNVYDYKTRQSMSENEIKGNTKNSDKDYFRQLVFYKILLERDFHFRDKGITPSLVFVSPDKKGRCPIISLTINDEDIKNVYSEIDKLIESIWSGKIMNSSCEDKDCEWCKMRKLL